MSFKAFIIALAVSVSLQFYSLPVFAHEQIDDLTVLTVTINGETNSEYNQIELSLCDLEDLPGASFSTTTVWTNGMQKFTGIWMQSLLQHLGVTDGVVELVAINDYRISVPVSEFLDGGALLAYERNDSQMSARQNGPLWLVYNYDANPEFRSETIYSRSIWQLNRMIISH